jgi:phosphatidylinositol glycan class A protein
VCSRTRRENTVLRAQLEPELVSVIPNALVAEQFRPDPLRADPQHSEWGPPEPRSGSQCINVPRRLTRAVTIVVISRLVYRKGIDLLVASAPRICELFPSVRFVVGGDGPKMVELEQMREKYLLQDRIELLGSIRPSDVREVSQAKRSEAKRSNEAKRVSRVLAPIRCHWFGQSLTCCVDGVAAPLRTEPRLTR